MRKTPLISTAVFIWLTFSISLVGQAPTAVTDAASGLSYTGAALNGTVNANNDSTTVTFEYGTTTSYGTAITADQSPVTGTSDTMVSKTISGLTPGTTYHYRVVATNSRGTANGADMTFTTVVAGGIPTLQRNALIELYSSTDGESWTISTNWALPPGTESTWHGITVDPVTAQVVGIDLNNNNLVGTLPVELEELSALTSLNLSGNQLTGNIPVQLGSLSNLQYLYLHNNQLTGSIPAELGGLSNLILLYLHFNQLTGSIPTELGNLTNLNSLLLSSNVLSGEIPTGLTNLTALGALGIRYNALYTTDNSLLIFLNSRDSGWEDFQTVAPSDLAVQVLTTTSVRLNWTPITYIWGSGGYQAYYGTTSGGAYTYAGITADKSASQFDITGLNQGTQYYFVLNPRTDPYSYNQNTVESGFSQEVSVFLPGFINVLSPKENDVYNVRTTIPIQWDAPGLTGNVEIKLHRTDQPGERVLAAAQPVGTPLDYSVADDVAKGIYYIEVRLGSISGTSGNFYIDAQSRVIRVTSPAGGETFNTGEAISIAWATVRISGEVKITLINSGDSTEYEIEAARSYDGSPLSYTIPGSVTPGTYYIKVEQGSVSGKSGNFIIN
ncbi:MAG: hypothetical protein GY940_07675 [bacterium]|nr:hypothetical protein [bacterium]